MVAGFAEADASKIAVGQTAAVTFDALPSTSSAGTVTAVSATSTVVSNVVTYDETISLTNPPATVKSGMTATVAVTTQSESNVLEVPNAAITTLGRLSTVTLDNHGKQTTQRVTIGLQGDTETQISVGLSVGQTVVLPSVTLSTSTAGVTTGATGTGTGARTGGFGGATGGFAGGGLGGGGFGG